MTKHHIAEASQVKKELSDKGRPLDPSADLILAGIARSEDGVVTTEDGGLDEVPDLEVIGWRGG